MVAAFPKFPDVPTARNRQEPREKGKLKNMGNILLRGKDQSSGKVVGDPFGNVLASRDRLVFIGIKGFGQ